MSIETQFPIGCKVRITKGEDKGCIAEVTGHGKPEDFVVQNVRESVVTIKGKDKRGVGFTGWKFPHSIVKVG